MWHYYHGVTVDYTRGFPTLEAILDDWMNDISRWDCMFYGEEKLLDPVEVLNGLDADKIEQTEKDDAKDWFKGYKRN